MRKKTRVNLKYAALGFGRTMRFLVFAENFNPYIDSQREVQHKAHKRTTCYDQIPGECSGSFFFYLVCVCVWGGKFQVFWGIPYSVFLCFIYFKKWGGEGVVNSRCWAVPMLQEQFRVTPPPYRGPDD